MPVDLMQQHLDIVKNRIEKQSLSVLELQELRSEKLQAAIQNPSPEQRKRLQAEAMLIGGMIEEGTGPAMSPEERIAELREKGDFNSADSLQHTLNIRNKQAEIDGLKEKLESGDGWGQQEAEKQLEEAQSQLAALKSSSPVFDRIQRAKDMRTEAENLRSQAGATASLGTHDAEQRSAALSSQSAKLFEQAERLEHTGSLE